MLIVFGSVALDTIRVHGSVFNNTLGGAATFSSIAASFFTNIGTIATIGNDFPKKYLNILCKYTDIKGIITRKGKTFRYDGEYDKTLTKRKTLKTELNVLDGFKPEIPDLYKKCKFIYLANNDPDQNIRLLKESNNITLSMCDTIDFWISKKKTSVIKMMKNTDIVTINEEEAKLLTKENNIIKCANKIMKFGTKYVLIKRGECGSIFFYEDLIFPCVAFPLENVMDPTGAGDSFGGAMMGYLAKKKSTKLKDIKKAIMYGNILGSFAVENYGIKGLLDVNKLKITERINTYEKMIN